MKINKNLGLWFDQRVNSSWSWLITLIIILGSIRGVIVINADLSARIVYLATAIALLILATYGFILSGRYKDRDLASLKRLLIINMLLGIVNFSIDLLLGIPFEASFLYLYLAPYAVFLFVRVPHRYLNIAVTVITIAISYSVADNFYETLKGPEGVQAVFDYNLKLRPDTFEGMSTTAGSAYRAGGYTGSYHDSANILGMAVVFFFIRFLLKRNVLDLVFFLGAILSLMLTQSAVNIVVTIFTLIIFSGYILIRSRKTSTFLYLLLGMASITVLTTVFGDVMSIFLARVGPDGDWEGMRNQLDMSSLVSALPFVLVGHAAGFKSGIVSTEIGFLKGIFQLGVVHAILLYWILLYPVFRFVKIRSLYSDALPSVAAIFFGFMSLLHYGSLFRVTNVFLFYALYAICLKNIIGYRYSMRLSDSLRHETVVTESHSDPRH